jgi:hypothetical protein
MVYSLHLGLFRYVEIHLFLIIQKPHAPGESEAPKTLLLLSPSLPLFPPVYFYILKIFLKIINFFLFFYLLQINIYLVFLYHFDVLILKIKKHHFNVFLNEKQPQPHSQIRY